MTAPRIRVPVHPLLAPERTIDLHEVLVRAIERELERGFSGNSVLNRLEAEAQLERLLREANHDAEMESTRKADHG